MPTKTPNQAETTNPTPEQPTAPVSVPAALAAEGYPDPVRVVLTGAEVFAIPNELEDQPAAQPEEVTAPVTAPVNPILDENRLPTPQEAKHIRLMDARKDLLQNIRDRRANPAPAYVPPPMTDRQLSKREQEMQAGRDAIARKKGNDIAERRPRLTEAERTAEGYNTPVPRDGHKVPNFKEGQTGARTVRES